MKSAIIWGVPAGPRDLRCLDAEPDKRRVRPADDLPAEPHRHLVLRAAHRLQPDGHHAAHERVQPDPGGLLLSGDDRLLFGQDNCCGCTWAAAHLLWRVLPEHSLHVRPLVLLVRRLRAEGRVRLHLQADVRLLVKTRRGFEQNAVLCRVARE